MWTPVPSASDVYLKSLMGDLPSSLSSPHNPAQHVLRNFNSHHVGNGSELCADGTVRHMTKRSAAACLPMPKDSIPADKSTPRCAALRSFDSSTGAIGSCSRSSSNTELVTFPKASLSLMTWSSVAYQAHMQFIPHSILSSNTHLLLYSITRDMHSVSQSTGQTMLLNEM